MTESKNVVIKISGDLIKNKEAIKFIRDRAEKMESRITVIVGGGAQINAKFKEKNIPIIFEKGIRVHTSRDSRAQAVYVLQETQQTLEIHLYKGWSNRLHSISLISPYKVLDRTRPVVFCHFNGDEYLEMMTPNFDEAHCLSRNGRTKNLSPGIQVHYFDEPESREITDAERKMHKQLQEDLDKIRRYGFEMAREFYGEEYNNIWEPLTHLQEKLKRMQTNLLQLTQQNKNDSDPR